MSRAILATCALALALPNAARAQEIDIRLSIKYVLNAQGQRTAGTYGNPVNVQNVIAQSNEALFRWGRGYRYLITEFVDVPGSPQFFDLTQVEYYQLEDAAETSPATFAWRTNAINVFVVNSIAFAGGAGAIPSSPLDQGGVSPPYELVTISGGISPDTGWPHELHHHYDLYHTFDNDLVADTLYDPESTCLTQFGCSTGGNKECCCATKLALLNAEGYSQVDEDNLLYNIMSYYGANDCVGLISPPFDFPTILLTTGQLDRCTDATRKYAHLAGEVSGYTYFVDKAFGGTSNGYSTNPYKTVLAGVTAATAAAGNIVLVRQGSYAEPMTISAPVTLRAVGTVTIGQ